jgi:alpha-L-fucosidase
MSDPALPEVRSQRPGAWNDPRLDWWRDARYGMFIHWGLYAIPAGVWRGQAVPGIGEWIMKHAQIPVREYEQLAAQFNPVHFDAAAIVRLAKQAGQKYLVFTSKHHDGFCLFKTQYTTYNSVDGAPFGRDVVGELAAECQKQGMRFGLYYSQTQDWHHPDGDGNDWDFDESKKDFDGYLENYVKPQMRELLTNYGPIALIWFDTPKGITAAQSQSLLEYCHQIQPDCLICGRIGNTLGDYASAGDNRAPASLQERLDWEMPGTINDTWGFKTDDHNWKSTETLIRKLADIVSKNGNYLLNIGPDALGRVPQPSVDRLLAVGAWLERNGEAIYGTRFGPIQGLEWCRSTRRGRTVYLHVFDWPAGGRLEIPAASLKARRAYLLADPAAALPLTTQGDRLVIQGPASAPDAINTVVALDTEA